jgi:O-methyltransferase involved in polyketide biosynthesis
VKEGEDGRVCYVAADLAVAGLREALRASPGFDPRGDTVYVAEGLLMYLRPERIASVLEAMRPEAPGRTRAIVSVVTPDRRGRVRLHTQREVVDLCMRWLDEPFAWGARRESLAALFAPHGMTVRDVVSPFDLRERHLPSRARRRLPRATGELVVIAEGAASLG